MNIEDLNEAQRQAVCRTEGPVLILAGAGSGKTKVLTTRISYLVEEKEVHPSNILAITFTNKAANEMKERVEKIIGEESRDMWISTFHSCCVRILRKDINKIGYNRSFVIYDSPDQVTLVKECLKELEIDEKVFPPKDVIYEISSAKDKMISPSQYEIVYKGDKRKEKIGQIYTLYQDRLKRNSALDFDDLIYKTVELFNECEDVLEFYRNKFKYIMVDEYQDTSKAQYTLIGQLAKKHQNICVVGDDDQSIYGWRGADIRNILEFEKDYDDVFVVKLEQNYRSTQVILDAANSVISNNVERKKKRLWSDKKDGEKVKIKLLANEVDEANYVANEIYEHSLENNLEYSDYAILYRANAQARVVEDALNRFQIPYNIYGGTKFYERKEIKDLIGYIKVIVNPQDDVSVKRIINVPSRGIGLRTIEKLEDRSKLLQESLYLSLLDVDNNSEISTKARKSINQFLDLIGVLRGLEENLPVSKMVEKILDVTGYRQSLEEIIEKNIEKNRAKAEEAQDRLDNLSEFISIAMEYERNVINNEEKNLLNFLSSISLSTDTEEEENANIPKVSLMTMHSSKGLEFPVVFIVGMEEKIFPISRAVVSMSDSAIEEERRLCYVGITRAMKELYLTYTSKRTLYGNVSVNIKSRFLSELPVDSINILDTPVKDPSYKGADYSLLEKYASKYMDQMNEYNLKKAGAVFKKSDRVIDDSFYDGNAIDNDEGRSEIYSDNTPSDKEEVDKTPYNSENLPRLKKGSKIRHPKFGEGIVISKVGADITVAFTNKGVKNINIQYTTIEVEEF